MVLYTKISISANLLQAKCEYDFVEDFYNFTFSAGSYAEMVRGLRALADDIETLIEDVENEASYGKTNPLRPGSQRGLASRSRASRGQEDAEGTGSTTTSD